jgi:hypothetical protein
VVVVYVSCAFPSSVAAYGPPGEEAAKRAVRCAKPGSEECVRKCEAINATCAHHAEHPKSPSSGDGDLYYCERGQSEWQCRYRYKNGDTCTLREPRHVWTCMYPTPQGAP